MSAAASLCQRLLAVLRFIKGITDVTVSTLARPLSPYHVCDVAERAKRQERHANSRLRRTIKKFWCAPSRGSLALCLPRH
jgi:hypothetical protein